MTTHNNLESRITDMIRDLNACAAYLKTISEDDELYCKEVTDTTAELEGIIRNMRRREEYNRQMEVCQGQGGKHLLSIPGIKAPCKLPGAGGFLYSHTTL